MTLIIVRKLERTLGCYIKITFQSAMNCIKSILRHRRTHSKTCRSSGTCTKNTELFHLSTYIAWEMGEKEATFRKSSFFFHDQVDTGAWEGYQLKEKFSLFPNWACQGYSAIIFSTSPLRLPSYTRLHLHHILVPLIMCYHHRWANTQRSRMAIISLFQRVPVLLLSFEIQSESFCKLIQQSYFKKYLVLRS